VLEEQNRSLSRARESNQSTALGKDVKYEQIPLDEFAENVKANGRDMFTPFFIQHIREVAKDHQDGIVAGMNDFVQTIGGAAPTSIHDFALENRSALE
jgi:NAD(P)H dehydrogenase (quinone)